MTTKEKDDIKSKARVLINLLYQCDDWQFVDNVVYAITGNDETLLDNI